MMMVIHRCTVLKQKGFQELKTKTGNWAAAVAAVSKKQNKEWGKGKSN